MSAGRKNIGISKIWAHNILADIVQQDIKIDKNKYPLRSYYVSSVAATFGSKILAPSCSTGKQLEMYVLGWKNTMLSFLISITYKVYSTF